MASPPLSGLVLQRAGWATHQMSPRPSSARFDMVRWPVSAALVVRVRSRPVALFLWTVFAQARRRQEWRERVAPAQSLRSKGRGEALITDRTLLLKGDRRAGGYLANKDEAKNQIIASVAIFCVLPSLSPILLSSSSPSWPRLFPTSPGPLFISCN